MIFCTPISGSASTTPSGDTAHRIVSTPSTRCHRVADCLRALAIKPATSALIEKKSQPKGPASWLILRNPILMIQQELWWSCRGAAPRVRKAGLPLSPGSASNLS